MIKQVSQFAQGINFPICSFLDQLATEPFNQTKTALSFLSGDATVYGQKQFKMPERGYQIVRENIFNQNNHGYSASSGLPTLRNAIKDLYHPKFDIDISDVLINHGVNMGLLTVLMAFTNEGDEILVPETGYPFFQDVCPSMNRIAIPYKLIKGKNFEIDLQDVAKLISDKTTFIYLINPTNPMGTVFSRKHMQQILSFCDQHELPIVCDQVYYKMVYPGFTNISFGDLTDNVPVIILNGVQKMLSVPGWVQSWTVIFDKNHILDQVKHNLQVLATIFLHTNIFTQHSIAAILKEIGIFTSNNMQFIYQNYLYLRQKLQQFQGLNPLPAQGTIYLAVQIDLTKFKSIKSDIDWIKLLRKQQNVSLFPLSVMSSNLQGFRFLTCADNSYYDVFLERLTQFVMKHKI